MPSVFSNVSQYHLNLQVGKLEVLTGPGLQQLPSIDIHIHTPFTEEAYRARGLFVPRLRLNRNIPRPLPSCQAR